MTFWEHLDVLRMSLFRILGAMMLAFIGSFIVLGYIFDSFILGPTSSDFFLYSWLSGLGNLPMAPDFGQDFHVDIININVASQFMTHMSTSMWLSLVVVCPVIIYELWLFVKPALYKDEIKHVSFAFFGSTLMFYLGCALGYSVVFPMTFRFLTTYTVSETIQNQISLNSYIGMFVSMIFLMGMVFELPLLAWLLSKLGILRRSFLRKYRRHAVVVLLIAAAVITPSGDPFTLMTVFLPLYLLYEFSIFLVKK